MAGSRAAFEPSARELSSRDLSRFRAPRERRRTRPMTDLLLQAWVAAVIERTKVEWMLGRGTAWIPGERLKLLFAGYNGTRNTGSDVRVEEMLRQVRQVLGANQIELTVTALDFEL